MTDYYESIVVEVDVTDPRADHGARVYTMRFLDDWHCDCRRRADERNQAAQLSRGTLAPQLPSAIARYRR